MRSFKGVTTYALTDGACGTCTFCSRAVEATYSSPTRIVMVLAGSSEPQRYREQMSALMPRIAKCLDWGTGFFTMPLRDLRDRAYMGDKVDMRSCVCSLCAAVVPEPEPEPELEPEPEEEQEEEWDE